MAKNTAKNTGDKSKSNKSANTGKGGSKSGSTGKAGGAVAEVATVQGRVIAEKLAGKVLTGTLETTIKRHTLTGESVSAMIKRLLMTAGQTQDTILRAMEAKDARYANVADAKSDGGKLARSTLNTTRADLKRTIGGDVLATGWRTDGKAGKVATAAVAKLRTHALGASAYSVELVRAAALVQADVKADAKASE